MNLVADIGNTLVKMALFDNGRMIAFESGKDETEVLSRMKTGPDTRLFWISVRPVSVTFKEKIAGFDSRTFEEITRLPFRNDYGTPGTLGQDRIAAVAGAVTMFPGKDLLVIDAGTCVTFDFCNARGEYLGGSIAPGLAMRYKALHNFTGRLPLLDAPPEVPALTGRDTAGSIHSGALNGFLEEIRGMVKRYDEKYPGLQVTATGGDLPWLTAALKNHIFADPFLLLKGLDTILKLNA